MKNIVLLSYGEQVEHQRAVYSILSILAWKGETVENVRIICYTDNAEYFQRYLQGSAVHYAPLTAEFMQRMLAGTGYAKRRKICILQDVYSSYPHDDIVFLDSDTFFFNDVTTFLDQLQPGNSIMYAREFRVENATRKYREIMSRRLPNAEKFPKTFMKLIENNEFDIGGRKVTFNILQYVWNSGVLGINKSLLPILSDVIYFNDRIFSETKCLISEQLSLSLILQSFSQIKPAVDFIKHYYQSKEIVDFFINRILNDAYLDLNTVERLEKIKASSLTLSKLVTLDIYVLMSGGAFKRRRYRRGFKFAFRAIQNIPASSWTFAYLKSMYNLHLVKKRSNQSNI
jgi:hypothetical protein